MEYEFSNMDKTAICMTLADIHKWINTDPKRAEKYFEERKEYVMDGLTRMPDNEVIAGVGPMPDLLTMERALLAHKAIDDISYMDHILLPETPDILEKSIDETMSLPAEEKNELFLNPRSSMLWKQNDIRKRCFDFGDKGCDHVIRVLEDKILERMKNDLLHRLERYPDSEMASEVRQDDPMTALIRSIKTEIDYASPRNTTGEVPDFACIDFGYSHALYYSPLRPEFQMALCYSGFLVDAGYQPSQKEVQEMTKKIYHIITDCVKDAAFLALDDVFIREQKFRGVTASVLPTPQDIAELAVKKSQIFQPAYFKEASQKLNPYGAKRIIKEKPDGYYLQMLYDYLYLSLLKEGIAEDRKQSLLLKLQGKDLKKQQDAQKKELQRLEDDRTDLRQQNAKLLREKRQLEIEAQEMTRTIKKQEELIQIQQTMQEQKSDQALLDKLQALQQKIDYLEEENRQVKAENQSLMQKAEALSDAFDGAKTAEPAQSGMLVYGQEAELYEGEFREILYDLMEDKLPELPRKSRRHDVLGDLLKANEPKQTLKAKREYIKQIFRNKQDSSPKLTNDFKEVGILKSTDNSHAKYTYYGDPRYQITIAKSTSDYRAGLNNAQIIINKIY